MAVLQNFSVHCATDAQVRIQVDDESNSPLNLTGMTAEFIVMFDANQPRASAVITKTTPTITFVNMNGTSDGMQVPLSDTDLTIQARPYYFEARAVDALENSVVVCHGTMTVKPSPI
jgi:hypothetical protein